MQIRKLKGMNQKIRLYYLRVTLKHIVKRKKYFLSNSKNKSNITDIVITLNESDENKADVLLYPEQGIPIQEIYSLVRFSKKNKNTCYWRNGFYLPKGERKGSKFNLYYQTI